MVSSADEDEVDCHGDPDGGEDEAEEDGVAGDSPGLPGAGVQFVNELNVAEGGEEIDEDAKGNQSDSGPEGDAGGVDGEMGFGDAELAEEEAEAADCEAYAHEAEAGANPGEKGSLCRQVDAGVLLCGLVHGGIVRPRAVRQPQVLRLRLSQGAREASLRMTGFWWALACGGPRWSSSVGSGRLWF
jgi:hypothetical protein